jgi:hypothetical protein
VSCLISIKEGSTRSFTVQWVDSGNLPLAPSSAQYRIDSITTGVVVRDWTDIPAPVSPQTIKLALTDAVLTDSSLPSEVHRMTVLGSYNLDDVIIGELEYTITNTLGV